MTYDENMARYRANAHAMQSGVAYKMQYEADETTPKHLRVGVNSAMVEHSALAKILIDKGILTKEEYAEGLADMMEEEEGRYQRWLEQRLGIAVTLG